MKRFTDTEKWKDDWYLDLTNDQKIIYQYVLDNCSNAGILKKNFRMLNYCCSTNITEEDFKKLFERRIIDLKTHFFFPKFLKFQNPRGLNSQKPAVIGIRNELEAFNLTATIREWFGNDFLMIKQSLSNDKSTIRQSLNNDSLMDIGYRERDKGIKEKGVQGEKEKGETNLEESKQVKDLNFQLKQIAISAATEKTEKRRETIQAILASNNRFFVGEETILSVEEWFRENYPIILADLNSKYSPAFVKKCFKDFEFQNNHGNWKDEDKLRQHFRNFTIKKNELKTSNPKKNGSRYHTEKQSYGEAGVIKIKKITPGAKVDFLADS